MLRPQHLRNVAPIYVMGLPWFKFFPGDWLKAADLRRCSPAARGVWIDLLCFMWDCDERGVLRSGNKPWTDDEVAAAIAGPHDIVLAGIQELYDKGVVSRSEGGSLYSRRMRREFIVCQKRATAGRTGGLASQANRKQTAKQKPSKTLISDSDSDSDSGSHSELNQPRKERPSMAETIYQAYPRHVGKAKALLAIDKAIEVIAQRDASMRKAPASWLLERVQKFADSPAGKRGNFTPYPATWFNGGRYDDDDAEWQRTGDGPAERNAPHDSGGSKEASGPATQRQARKQFEDDPIRPKRL